MPRLRTGSAKERFLKRMRKQRLHYIAVLPSLITLINAICGFAAIILTSKDHFAAAAMMIFIGMIADMLDGRVARMSKSTSSFGGQLDSLCDVITFGLAPAFLMLGLLGHTLSFSSTSLTNFSTRLLWLVSATYISCAAIRLARFNVENEEDESAHMSFVGLPTPAAAGVIASIIMFQQEVLPDLLQEIVPWQESNIQLYNLCHNAITICDGAMIYSLPFITFGLGLLMVSRVRYPHVVNQYIKGKKPFAHLIKVLLLLGLVIWSIQTVLMVVFCGFALSGFVKWLCHNAFRKKVVTAEATPEPENN